MTSQAQPVGVMDTNLGGTEAAVTSEAQPAAMSLPLAEEALRLL